MSEPKVHFENNEELRKYLYEWQARLCLSDWIIQAVLTPVSQMSNGERIDLGRNNLTVASKTCLIEIADVRKEDDQSLLRYCGERVLVHELLHCKINFLNECDNMESRFYDVRTHQLLEELARAFILAKYSLPPSWFNNLLVHNL